MKKCHNFLFALLLAIIILQSICFVASSPKVSHADVLYYARIKYAGAPFLKQATADFSVDNTLFLLPQTYFVEVSEKLGSDFFRASYMNQVGYVRKSDIEFVKGIPTQPFANKLSFRVFAQNGLNLRTSPKESEGIANRVTTIPFLETNLQFIGQVDGEEAISNRGKTWYYCNYYRLDETLTGYVYGGYCDMLTTLTLNTEQLEVIDEPNFQQISVNSPSDVNEGINSLSQTSQIIIIVAVSLPALLILFLLFKPSKIVANLKSETKKSPGVKKKKKRYHDDYYEIED